MTSTIDQETAESDMSIREFLGLLPFLLGISPFILLTGLSENDVKTFLWGAGGVLVNISIVGFFVTVDIPDLVPTTVTPYLNRIGQASYAVGDILQSVFAMPETYVVLFIVGMAIMVVGGYRVVKYGVPEIGEE